MTVGRQDGHVQDINEYLNSNVEAGVGKQSEVIEAENLSRKEYGCGLPWLRKYS